MGFNNNGVVKSEYGTTDLLDFSYLPERQCYDAATDCVIPHFDEFAHSKEELSLSPFLTCSHFAFMLPIHFTPYTSPYDINLRDVSGERGFLSSSYSS